MGGAKEWSGLGRCQFHLKLVTTNSTNIIKMPSKNQGNSKPDCHRNKVERQRQSEIDDEIQKLMCFLPDRRFGTQKLSRNQILKELYDVALETFVEKKPEESTSAEPKMD
ncbi:BHLH domain-containing protein [Caenorhabditis elegans]|uniref:BHLH domain-containing protein n=1 Tax=Caenorhabditis elegans TaxID=6239 RepID=Q4TTC2_CAEEL|nr:BHLH domain-containing protein [Caenorhabditis elegans]CCD64864.2 BHLH domain-containing protein [Caenorhabditis elegans]|eukprot:NP_001022517.2 Uncharacterized protein CELE_ZK177.11 [Caenorhabditis elegans]